MEINCKYYIIENTFLKTLEYFEFKFKFKIFHKFIKMRSIKKPKKLNSLASQSSLPSIKLKGLNKDIKSLRKNLSKI